MTRKLSFDFNDFIRTQTRTKKMETSSKISLLLFVFAFVDDVDDVGGCLFSLRS